MLSLKWTVHPPPPPSRFPLFHSPPFLSSLLSGLPAVTHSRFFSFSGPSWCLLISLEREGRSAGLKRRPHTDAERWKMGDRTSLCPVETELWPSAAPTLLHQVRLTQHLASAENHDRLVNWTAVWLTPGVSHREMWADTAGERGGAREAKQTLSN